MQLQPERRLQNSSEENIQRLGLAQAKAEDPLGRTAGGPKGQVANTSGDAGQTGAPFGAARQNAGSTGVLQSSKLELPADPETSQQLLDP